MAWIKRSQEEIKKTVFDALDHNIDFLGDELLGVPASYLDRNVFYEDPALLKEAAFLSALVQNPNHIGCHTRGKSSEFWEGTHELERDLIEMCAVDIFKGEPKEQDGYVAAGGTEANMQAVWVYRNFFLKEYSATPEQIVLLASADTHYSLYKSGNVLGLATYTVPVEEDTREIRQAAVNETIKTAQANGAKYFIVICNMMTTMFGSVDDIDVYVNALEDNACTFKIHVDGAYGGFYYPFMEKSSKLTFENPHITSFALDGHKMAQAPYGTGIFLIRKGLIEYTNTKTGYVEGNDFTLVGSRSGANAVAIWMILSTYGPYGWYEKTLILHTRTNWLCQELEERDIAYYRHPSSNIVTIKAKHMDIKVADKFGIIPDDYDNPRWYKVVVMEHVTIEKLELFLEGLDAAVLVG